jgi:uncharacterized protein YggE
MKRAALISLILGGLITVGIGQEFPSPPGTPGPDRSGNSLLRLVSVFATGEGKIAADSVTVSLVLESEASQLAQAVALNLKQKDTLAARLKSAGIAKKDIAFDNFSSDSQTGKLTGRVKKHMVTSPIRVIVRSESQFAAVALAVDQNEDLAYQGRRARISDTSVPQLKAAEAAVANLKKKAALYETAFGVKLELLSFEEIFSGSSPIPLLGENPITTGLRSGSNAISQAAIDGLIARQDSFGELTATVNLRGIYRITSAPQAAAE